MLSEHAVEIFRDKTRQALLEPSLQTKADEWRSLSIQIQTLNVVLGYANNDTREKEF